MKIFKYLLFLFLIIIIAGSIYIATKDGEFQVEQSKVIQAPREMVYNEVDNFKNWQEWEPWSQEAEDMVVNYFEKTKGEGAGYMWKSEDMGDGEIRTLEATPFSKINQKISFKTPFGESSSDVYWRFEETEEGTKVTWGMKGEQSFAEKLAFTFQDQSISEMMIPMFQQGLKNMETVLLKKMKEYSISVDGVIQHGGGFYMYTTTASKISQVDERMQKMIAEVSAYMEENEIEKTGNPFVLYNDWNDEKGTAIFSAGIFTSSEVITPAKSMVLNDYLPNQRVVKTTLKGDYKNLREAWEKAYAYIEKNGLEVNQDANPFEVYLSSADQISNPAKWVTHIYIPVK